MCKKLKRGIFEATSEPERESNADVWEMIPRLCSTGLGGLAVWRLCFAPLGPTKQFYSFKTLASFGGGYHYLAGVTGRICELA